MKTETLALVGIAAAAAAFFVTKKTPAPVDASNFQGVATGGLPGFVAAHGSQTQLTDAAIAKNWQDTFGALDKTDPAWWV